MKFATKALIGLGILAVGALYLKAKFDAAADAYPDEDFEFDKSLDDKDDTPYNPFDGSDDFLKHDDFAIPRSEQKTDTVAEKPEDEKVEVNKEEKLISAVRAFQRLQMAKQRVLADLDGSS